MVFKATVPHPSFGWGTLILIKNNKFRCEPPLLLLGGEATYRLMDHSDLLEKFSGSFGIAGHAHIGVTVIGKEGAAIRACF